MRGSESVLLESNRTRQDVAALIVTGGVKSSVSYLSAEYGVMWCSAVCRYFFYHPREILCPTHGRVQENIPWAEAYARITYRLEYIILV